jgi:drug/metabolite transporter (DMT)-like permease
VAVILLSQGAGLVVATIVLVVRWQGPPPAGDLAPAAAAGLIGLVAVGCFYRALAVGTISIVAPIAATSALVPVLVGLVRGERPGAVQAVGIVAAIVGVVLASREPEEPTAGPKRATGAGLAVASALLLGAFLLALNAARHTDLPWVLVTARASSVALLLLVAAVVRPGVPLAAVPPIALVGILDTTANGLFVAASSRGLLSVVGVLSSLYPVVTVALAQVHLGERIARIQQIGVALALTGVLLISAG